MRLLYITRYQFYKAKGEIYTFPERGDRFFEKYLDVFDGLDVLGEELKPYLAEEYISDNKLVRLTNRHITVELLPDNAKPYEFLKDIQVKKLLRSAIWNASAVLLKPDSRKGIMAIEICKELKKPYMVDFTADIYSELAMHKNFLRKLYAPVLYRQILAAIREAPFGLYVTEHYLQKKYPIAGKQCGCTDAIVDKPDKSVLSRRKGKIRAHQGQYTLGLIGGYHDIGKGIDTAIQALAMLGRNDVELHILGKGIEADRQRWIRYASHHGVGEQLFFDKPLSNLKDVLAWDDAIDIMVLPSRSEGLPRAIVEAISRACPCIVSNVCSLPELVNVIWLHPPGDSRRMAELVEKMLINKELMLEAAKENFERAKSFTQDVLHVRRNAFFEEFAEYCKR